MSSLQKFWQKHKPSACCVVFAVYRGTHVETVSVSCAAIVHCTYRSSIIFRVPSPVRSPCAPTVRVMPCTGHPLVFLMSCDTNVISRKIRYSKNLKFLAYIFLVLKATFTHGSILKVHLTEHLTVTVSYLTVTSSTLFLRVH